MMKPAAGFRITGAIVALLFLCSSAEAGDPVRGERLFRLTRNKNDNIVCYDVLQTGGRLDKDNPVSAYWVIPSAKNKLENLNLLERKKAYGVDAVKTYGQDSADIRLSASKRTLRVTMRDARWVALTTLDSREMAIDSIYVVADESGTMPTVKWVEIIGHYPGAGESVWKKIVK